MAHQFSPQDFIHFLLNPGSWILWVALAMVGRRERDRCDCELSSSLFSFPLFTTDRVAFWAFPCVRSRMMALSPGCGWESAEGMSSVCSIGLCSSVFQDVPCTYKKSTHVITHYPSSIYTDCTFHASLYFSFHDFGNLSISVHGNPLNPPF